MPVRQTVRAWFAVIEAELGHVDYSRDNELKCSTDDVPYINAVVHIVNKSWRVVCGNMGFNPESTWGRARPLAQILDRVVPTLDPGVNVKIPFGLRDSVQQQLGALGFKQPVLGTAYHPRYSPVALPFALGWHISDKVYLDTPVVGWDHYVRRWFMCNSSAPRVKKAVFRGNATVRRTKYGACTNVCDFKDNGRLYIHWLGQERPDVVDAAVGNADQFATWLKVKPKEEVYVDFPTQLCDYQAVLNVGSDMDWAGRLRQSFYGNAVIMLPEDPPQEFFSPFMQAYQHYWPIKADLSNTLEEVNKVLTLDNLTEQLQGQRDFAAQYLTEDFQLYYNKIVIEEYDARVRIFKEHTRRYGRWQVGFNATSFHRAKDMLHITGCTNADFVQRTCSTPTEALQKLGVA